MRERVKFGYSTDTMHGFMHSHPRVFLLHGYVYNHLLQRVDQAFLLHSSSHCINHALKDDYGNWWSELERLEGVGREGITRVCSLIKDIHLHPLRRSELGCPNDYQELNRLFIQLTQGTAAAEAGLAGPAFFDDVLQPYTQVNLGSCKEGGQGGWVGRWTGACDRRCEWPTHRSSSCM